MKKILSNIGVVSCCLIFSAIHSQAKAQTRTVTGTINDKEKPIGGVIVTQEGTNQVTTTSSSGTFNLQISGENPILIFRHPEYAERKITTNGKSTFTISLTEKVKSIEEVVLNAGYYNVKAKESTGSIAKVTAKDIENQPVNNVLSAIQGRIPGVSIIQNSGTPGGGYDVQIRGRNSLRTYGSSGYDANSPLYVIDGVPVPLLNEYKSGLSDGVLPYGDTSPLNSINPGDIETIDILKDADATAIYGSKGANGVVLITTKNGVKGKTAVQLSSSYGIAHMANLPEMMSTEEYLKMRGLAFANDGLSDYPSYEYDINGTWDAKRQTDWQRFFVGNTAELSKVQLGISGGSANTSFLLSGGHNEETSVFYGNYRYKRNTFAANLDHTATDKKLKIHFSAYYTSQTNLLPPLDFNMIYTALAPNAPALYTKEGNLNWENSTFSNPLAAASQTYGSSGQNLTANLNITYNLGHGFTANVSAGYGNFNTEEQRIYPKTFYDPAYNIGSERSVLRKVSMINKNWVIEPQLNYKKRWGIHQVTALLGASYQDQRSENQTLTGRNFPSDELIYDLSSASTVTVENAYSFIYRYQALYSRINYELNNRYFVNLSGRRDGSSRFGNRDRFGNFGAVGVAWLFSEEEVLKNLKWLSFGKLRASYGIAGSDQIGDYQFYDTYMSTGTSYNGFPGIMPTRLFNKNFGWEVTRKLETAMEWSFFKDRLFFTASWYRNTGTNQLVGIPLPATTGFSSVQANLNATVLNSGTEFSLQSHIIKNANWKWSASFNLTVPQSKLLRFPGLENSTYKNFYEVGKSTSLRKLYQYTGLDPVTGLYSFADMNGDGIINSKDRLVTKELKEYWFGGFQNSVQYKNWSLDLLLQAVSQSQSNIYASQGYLGIQSNMPAVFLDYWTPENTHAQFQKPSAGYDGDAANANSRFMESDATVTDTFTVRLRNVSLTYTIPSLAQSKVSAKIFIQGQNLLVLSNYKGANPEFSLPGYTAPLRTVSLGFNLSY